MQSNDYITIGKEEKTLNVEVSKINIEKCDRYVCTYIRIHIGLTPNVIKL